MFYGVLGCCNCYRCILQAGRAISGRVSDSVLCTTIISPQPAWPAAATASRSFLTQPCSALLRRNRHSTCGRDGDSIIFIKSSFGGSTEAINSDESLRLSPILSGLENKLCFIDEKAVQCGSCTVNSCTMPDRALDQWFVIDGD